VPVLSPPAAPLAPAASGSAALLASMLLLAVRRARQVRAGRRLDVAGVLGLTAAHTTTTRGGAS
jgi:hypothetical protein